MRIILTIILISLFLLRGYTQVSIDSLRQLVDKAESDTAKVNAMGYLIYELSYGNKDQAQQLVEEAMSLALKANYKEGIANINDLQGIIYLDKGDLDSAQVYFHKSLKYYQDMDMKKKIFSSYQKLAQLHAERNRFDQAFEYYSNSAKIAEELNDLRLMGNAQNGLGSFYISKGWHLLDNMNDTINYTSYFEKATPHINKAITHFEQAGFTKGVALAYANLAILEKEMNHLQQSMTYMRRAAQYFDEMNYHIYLVTAYSHIGKIHRGLQQYDSALIMAEKSLEISKEIESKFDIRNSYGEFSFIYQEMGNYKKALEYHQLYDDVNSQILNESKQSLIDEAELKYNSKQNERELALQIALNERQRLIMAIIAIIAFSLIVLISLLYRKSIRERHFKKILMNQNKELEDLNEEISTQRDQLSNSNKRLREVVNEQENIMAIVAHDLRSPLNKIKGLVEVMRLSKNMGDEASDICKKANEVAEDGLTLISDIIKMKEYDDNFAVNPKDLSLNKALNKIIGNHQSYATGKSIVIKLNSSEDIKLKIDPIHLSRIMDNLLSNAIKFSYENTEVIVNYARVEANLEIEITDQGPGFTEDDLKNVFKRFQKLSARPTAGENSSGLGLSIVKNLVKKLDGEISLDTKVGQGSTFKVQIPV